LGPGHEKVLLARKREDKSDENRCNPEKSERKTHDLLYHRFQEKRSIEKIEKGHL
jgi:hypothetical protein